MIAAPNRDEHDIGGTGISLPLYYMVGLVAFGAMTALISSGARIASERTDGWTRQLRITPLSPRAYLRAKSPPDTRWPLPIGRAPVRSGVSLGVSLPAGRWLEMTGLILIALVPFAALGILLGHLLTADSIGPATGWFRCWRSSAAPGSRHPRRRARHRPVPAVLLARARQPRVAGRTRLGRHGLDCDRVMDGRARDSRPDRLPP